MYRIIPSTHRRRRLTSSNYQRARTQRNRIWRARYVHRWPRTHPHQHAPRYKRVAAHTGSTPPENDATTWLDVRPTLKWAPFDGATTAAAEATDMFTYGAAGYCNAVSLHGLQGIEASISVKDAPGGTVVHTASASL